MAYKQRSPIIVAEGGTGAQTLTSNGVLLGNGTSAITATTAGTTGQVLTGVTGSAPTFQSPAASSISITGDTGGALVGNAFTFTGGTTGLAFGGSGSTETLTFAGITANGGTVSLATDATTSTINVGTGAGVKTSTFGSTNSTSATTVQSGSGGVALTGAVTSANAITVTSGAITASSGNVVITAGNLTLPNTTTTPTGEITFGGNRFVSNYGTSNTFIGQGSGNTTLTTGSAQNNACVGTSSGAALTTGSVNVALGSLALTSCTTSPGNVALGYSALQNLTTGSGTGANVGIGFTALQNITTGFRNTAVGMQALNAGNGSYNTALGWQAGINYSTSDSSNISIGNTGTASESNTIRIGTAGTGNAQQSTCYIAGINGVTVTGSAVLCSTSGQLGTVPSSIRFKESIEDMGDDSSAILNLRPVTFNYKKEEAFKNTPERQVGLIAEEVTKILPSLVVYEEDGITPYSVKYHDLPAMLLNELKKQNVIIQQLISRIEILEGNV